MHTMFRQLLSPEERVACWKLGMHTKFADAGVPVSRIDETIKLAAPTTPLFSVGGAAKAIMAMSLLTGIPLGIAAHVVGQRISATRNKEQELNAQVGYYRNATKQLEGGLEAANTK